MLRSRNTVHGKGLCQGVVLHLQGIDVVTDYLLLSVGSADIILPKSNDEDDQARRFMDPGGT